jgi:hypothetical protein
VPGELDGGGADRTRSTVDQDGLPGLKVRLVPQEAQCRRVGERGRLRPKWDRA